MLSECKDLDSYFQSYGDLLGARATKALAPLHIPGKDPDVAGIDEINEHVKRTRNSVLFGAQRDTLCGMVKAMRRQKAVILAAEMGTGKSLMGCAAAHVHAAGNPYRGLVMCPDHLIKKWGREIEKTCPGATWRSFDDWREVLAEVQVRGHAFIKEIPGTPPKVKEVVETYSVSTGVDTFEDVPLKPRATSGITLQRKEATIRPTKDEWWIIGRDQSKGDPAWETRVTKKMIWFAPLEDVRRLKAKGAPLADLVREVATCPKCGYQILDKDEVPMGYKQALGSKKKLVCKGQIERHRMEGDDCKVDLIECGEPLWSFVAARTKEEREVRNARRVRDRLNASTAPYRWPAYRSMKGIMKRDLDYLILDEVHELKGGDEVGQANAAGAFISRSKKVIALTGTLIGGYADHLFPMLLRMSPASLVASGFGWSEFGKFNARYGRIETQVRTTSGSTKSQDYEKSNSHSKGSSTRVQKIRRPGIMPQLYGDHLVDKAVFLPLDQVSDGLPALTETIIPIDMDDEQEEAYRDLESWLVGVVKQMMATGDKRLLATMLENLLYYLDHPFGWDAISTDDDEFTPATLDSNVVRPKEEALIGLCHSEAAQGRQVWVYVQRVNNRDVAGRLSKLLADSGLRSGILRSSISPREREEWIYKKGKDLDVCISHPDLVKTGLDLFAPDGNHNFPTLVFYQTGYNTFTMRQASRRSWRIGQKLTCKTVFMYYAISMQERCMTHMGKKMAACEAIDGKFSAEGLAAMAGEDDATMALAKALVDKVQMPAGHTWSKTLGFDKPAAAVPTPQPVVKAAVSFSTDELEILKRLHARMCGMGA